MKATVERSEPKPSPTPRTSAPSSVAAPKAPSTSPTLAQPAGTSFRAPDAPSMTPRVPAAQSKRLDRST